MSKILMMIAALCGFVAVAGGAFGAHALKSRLPADLLRIFETGIHYLMFHTVALFLTGILLHFNSGVNSFKWAGWLFIAGIGLFSGSLMALSLTGVRVLGAITPFGGIAFLVGWLLLALGIWKHF